jgi:hypothetical protein
MTEDYTPYDELNRLLVELTATARDILGDSFAGTYPQLSPRPVRPW